MPTAPASHSFTAGALRTLRQYTRWKLGDTVWTNLAARLVLPMPPHAQHRHKTTALVHYPAVQYRQFLGAANEMHGVRRQLLGSGSFDGTVRLWDATSRTCLRTLRSDRRYERLDITGLTGVTDAQHAALLALGAVERQRPQSEPAHC
jgi:hypothetical protein